MSENWHKSETYKSLITISIEAFKFCVLVNGGAVVAILAYLGNVASKMACTLPDMDSAMYGFLGGLIACSGAIICSYLTQLQLLQENKEPHVFYLWGAMGCVALSISGFIWGAWEALQVF